MNDSKSIYGIVVFFVIALGISAYFLQGKIVNNNQVVNNADISSVINNDTSKTSSSTIKINSIKLKNLIIIKNKTATATSTATTTQETEQVSSTDSEKNILTNVSGAVLKTNLGDIEIQFLDTTPNTVANFVSLAIKKTYDGIRFHKVIRDYKIETGDPLSKDLNKKAYWGTGGPGYKFADELNGKEEYKQGVVAMSNSGTDTNGSQFFIITAYPGYPLPPNYTIFAKVIKGMDVALNIQTVKTDNADRPIEDVIISEVILK